MVIINYYKYCFSTNTFVIFFLKICHMKKWDTRVSHTYFKKWNLQLDATVTFSILFQFKPNFVGTLMAWFRGFCRNISSCFNFFLKIWPLFWSKDFKIHFHCRKRSWLWINKFLKLENDTSGACKIFSNRLMNQHRCFFQDFTPFGAIFLILWRFEYKTKIRMGCLFEGQKNWERLTFFKAT